MTSAWVLIIASVLHFGLRRSCFMDIEQMPMLRDTLYARHIAYCAVLHFLYDQELLPARYRRRMGLLIGFLVELVLGVAFMEVLGQWVWIRVEYTVYRCLLLFMRNYGDGLNPDLGLYLEKAFMRGVMTSLAGLLWLNAYAATEPEVPQVAQVATAKTSMAKSKHRPLAKRSAEQPARRNKGQEQGSQQDQKQKLKQKLKQKMKLMQKQKADRKLLQEQGKDKERQQKQEQSPELPVPEEAKVSAPPEEQQHLAALATTSDC